MERRRLSLKFAPRSCALSLADCQILSGCQILEGVLVGCQDFWLADRWLLKLKKLSFEAPLKRQKWLRNLSVNTPK